MRVLIINTVYKRGGAVGIAQTLQRELNHLNGWESLFAYGRGPKAKEPGTVRFALQPEIYLHVALTRLTGLQGYGTWLSTKRLIRLIREWKPEVIHFHNIHGYYLNLSIAKAVGNLGIPVVWTLHDAWPLTGRCAYFFDCNRWKIGCGRCPHLRSYPKAYIDTSRIMWHKKRELLGGVWNPVIVTPSQWLAGLVSEACKGRCRVEVIPNGIDTQIFRPRDRQKSRDKLGLPRDKKIILFAAADLKDERKGARYFFESLNYIDGTGWMVVTVGKPIEIPRALKRRVNIRQLGYCKGSEAMAEVYSAADLFCTTSLDDNFPTTVLESMSCGTPVIGFSVGGIPEQITKECGILVSPKDSKALAQAMSILLRDDRSRQIMGKQCREKAVKEYDQKVFVERYLTLYHGIVQRGKV